MRKILFSAMFLFISILLSPTSHGQVVCEKENLDKIFIETTDVEDFFSKYYNQHIKFEEIKVAEKDKAYYLLAKEADNPKVYAFRLYRKFGSSPLKLTALNYVTSCNCAQANIENFIFNGKKIVRCLGPGHSTYGAY